MSDPLIEMVNENQVRAATMLLGAGADVNAKAERLLDRVTPLHGACDSAITTNLDLIQHSLGASPSAVLFVLEHCGNRVDTEIVNSRGMDRLSMVRLCITECDSKIARAPSRFRKTIQHNVAQLQTLEQAIVARQSPGSQ